HPADSDADPAHRGENTAIGFATRDTQGVQEALIARGVRFSQKAEKQPWGGWAARFLDADDNVYSLMQMDLGFRVLPAREATSGPPATRPPRRRRPPRSRVRSTRSAAMGGRSV